MKIIAMLSLYNEKPELIAESISRVKALGVDELICCDGPYDLYPDKEWNSPDECRQTAYSVWTGGSRAPGSYSRFTWLDKRDWKSGNEVEKRNFMLGYALEIAEEGDWLLVFDSDHMWEFSGGVTPGPRYFLDEALKYSDHRAVEVAFADCAIDAPDPSWYEACLIYRAVPGMRYEGAHWRIRFPDGTVSTTLRTEQEKHTAPTLDLRDSFRVRHTVYQAGEERRARQGVWYDRRDSQGLEK